MKAAMALSTLRTKKSMNNKNRRVGSTHSPGGVHSTAPVAVVVTLETANDAKKKYLGVVCTKPVAVHE